MTQLQDPLVEACAKARLIETRSQAIAGFARTIAETSDPMAVKPEEWDSFRNDLKKLLKELEDDIDDFATKAQYGT
jgi:hypothetical protein